MTGETMNATPYVGPRTFSEAQRNLFFGREREARDLLARVLSERLLLFYAQSGAGKSSLLHTRLIPQLRDEKGFGVLPVGRVSGDLPPGVPGVQNIFVFNLLLSIDQEDDPAPLVDVTLDNFLARLVCRGGHWSYDASVLPAPTSGQVGQRYILIIDQFEEIFTSHPENWADREAFFLQLDHAMQADPNLWVLLVLREDYVAALDPYAPLVDDRLRGRYYMERMDVAAALAAIQEPAKAYGRPFAPGVAEQLVDDLRRIKVLGQTTEQLGQFVEPVQLQVVCYQLWANLTKQRLSESDSVGEPSITTTDLKAAGDVNTALARFYEEIVASVLAETAAEVSERQLRTWFDGQLITPAGTRGLVLQGAEDTGGLSNVIVRQLQARFLVRSESRAGSAWVELVHDRFVDPIRLNNAAWWPQHLSALQQQADLWSKQSPEQRDGFLLSGEALVQAEQWAATHGGELLDVEKDFLANCRSSSIRAIRQKRMNRLIFGLLVLAVLFSMLAIYELNRAEAAKREALREARSAHSGELAAEARRAIDTRPDDPSLALKLSIQAVESTWTEDHYVPASASSVLIRSIQVAPAWRQTLIGHKDQVNYVAISADGERILSSSADYSARVWDMQSGRERLRLEGHFGNINQAVFSQDGRRIYTVGNDVTVREWDAATGRELRRFQEPSLVFSVAVSADGRLLTGNNDHRARIWDLATGKILHILRGHESVIWSVSFSPDGSRVLTASGDGTAQIWDAVSGRSLLTLRVVEGGLKSAHYSPSGDRIVTAGTDHTVRIWDATNGRERGKLTGHTDIVNSAMFNGEGTLIVSASEDHSVRIWDPSTMSELRRLQGHKDPVNCAIFSPDNHLVITAGADHTIRIWDAHNRGGVQEFSEVQGAIQSVAFNPNGSELATAGQNGTIRLWDRQTGRSLLRLNGHSGPVNHVEFSSDGTELISAGNDGTARIWNSSTGRQSMQVHVLSGILFMARLAPQGDLLATAGSDEFVRLWNVKTGAEIAKLVGHQGSVKSLAFSSDGHLLISGGDDGVARLWDMQSQTLVTQFIANPAQDNPFIDSVMFSPDNHYIITDGYDGIVRIWDASSLRLVRELGKDLGYQAQPGTVHRAIFSPDGRQVASGGGDGIVHLWNVSDWQELLTISADTASIYDLAFAPQGDYVATANADHRARFWPIQIENMLKQAQSLIQRDAETTSAAKSLCSGTVHAAFQSAYTTYKVRLGCPIGDAYPIESTAQQMLQGGRMFWRNDNKPILIVFDRLRQDGRKLDQGVWESSPDEKWDGRNPDGIGLTPPPGMVEPILGFGWLWRTYYGGPTGPLGWALGPEEVSKETLVQEFTQGFLWRSSASEGIYVFLYSNQFFVMPK